MTTTNVRYNFQIPVAKSQAFELTRANKKLNKTEYLCELIDLGFNLEFKKDAYYLVSDEQTKQDQVSQIELIKSIRQQTVKAFNKNDVKEIRRNIQIMLELLMKKDYHGEEFVLRTIKTLAEDQKKIEAF